jgi:hypothetical protein
MKIEISKYTKKTSGRYRDSGNYSGEWFLEDILWPLLKDTNEKIEINFDNCDIHPAFLDAVFSNLISKYKFTKSGELLLFKCNDKNILMEIIGIIIGAEFKTFGKVFTKF